MDTRKSEIHIFLISIQLQECYFYTLNAGLFIKIHPDSEQRFFYKVPLGIKTSLFIL